MDIPAVATHLLLTAKAEKDRVGGAARLTRKRGATNARAMANAPG